MYNQIFHLYLSFNFIISFSFILHPSLNCFPTIARLTHVQDTLSSSNLRLSNLGMLLRLLRLP